MIPDLLQRCQNNIYNCVLYNRVQCIGEKIYYYENIIPFNHKFEYRTNPLYKILYKILMMFARMIINWWGVCKHLH